jgi:CubicO group peptidase (beta-lactamase class C family)
VLAEAGRIEGIRSFVVAQDGQIVAERYYNGAGPYSVHDVRSASKSVLSALIGIAIQQGFIESVDQTLADYLDPAIFELDGQWAEVTIEDLLTMSAGHRWRELNGPSEYGEFVAAPDQVAYILSKPVVDPPGTRFNYSDGSAHLLSVVLTEATGMTAAEFAAEHLFQPLAIGSRTWRADNQGYTYGGFGLHISPYDMLTFGTLYLNEGRVGDQQIVPADWVGASTQARVASDDALPYGPGYGYLWWQGGTGAHDFYFATGYGGQFIVNVPGLRLTVVATCLWGYPRSQASQHWFEILDLIVDSVIPTMD